MRCKRLPRGRRAHTVVLTPLGGSDVDDDRPGSEDPLRTTDTTGKGLSGDSLTFFGTLAIGLASVAPAYSLAATLGYVVIETGVLAPVAVILGFIPMLLTAFAYRELNRVIPDCGTTFTWVTKAFGPRTGWFSGWVLAMAGIIVLANLAQVAAQYSYYLVGADDLADSTFWVTVLGVVFIAAMTYVSFRGIEIANWLQNVLVGDPVRRPRRCWSSSRFVAVFGGDRPDTAHRHLGLVVQPDGVLQGRRRRLGRADRGHDPDGLHLLGLGHDPVAQRGDEGQREHSRPGGRRRDADPAGDVPPDHRRRGLLRRRRHHRHRARQRGQRRRRLQRDRRAGARQLGAGS